MPRNGRWSGMASASVTPNRRLSVAAGFGDRDLDVAGLDLVRLVVAGDRERRMRRQQNVLAHVRFVSGVVLEELGHGVGGDGPAHGRPFVIEVERQPRPTAEDL